MQVRKMTKARQLRQVMPQSSAHDLSHPLPNHSNDFKILYTANPFPPGPNIYILNQQTLTSWATVDLFCPTAT